MIAMDSIHNTFTTNPFDKTKVRMVVDNIENAFAMAYVAHPDRVFVIDADDRMAFTGQNIDEQLHEPEKLMTEEVRNWLENNL